MNGPVGLLRQNLIDGLKSTEPIFEWQEGRTSLVLDEVEYQGHKGAIMVYTNPPVHQIGNPGLEAMIQALGKLQERKAEFLLLTWPCDPVHAGGDLKESQTKLKTSNETRKDLESRGAPQQEIETLYSWADGRLDKGQTLYRTIRDLSKNLRTVGVCGGGLRFGGSAEVNLMADFLVGDSRSGMCFSEAMIGLIPGWAGVGRAVTKAGVNNARYMAQTATTVMAPDLVKIGVYDHVVEVTDSLPRMNRTGDKEADKAAYKQALEDHDKKIWPALVEKALDIAVRPEEDLPSKENRLDLVTSDQIETEIARRANPETYSNLWGKSLKEAKEEIKTLGRPLAPQSVEELDGLFKPYLEGQSFDEDAFVEAEKQADARLYRDLRLLPGIEATLEQKVADFRTI